VEQEIQIAKNLLRLRSQYGYISLKKLSDATKVPYGTLYSWEANNVQPKSWKQAKAVADHFKISIDELVFGRGGFNGQNGGIISTADSTLQIEVKGPIEIRIRKP